MPADSWVLIHEQRSGYWWGSWSRPQLYRVYQTTDTVDAVERTCLDVFTATPWHREARPPVTVTASWNIRWTRGGWYIRVGVPSLRARDYPPHVPLHLTKVEVWVGTR